MAHDFKRFPELTNPQMAIYYFESPHKQITESFMGKITKVIDGDTVKIEWEKRNFEFRMRLAKIAAPELGEGGEEAQKYLEGKILGAEVEIIIDPNNRVEKWGRLLGEIMHRGINIGEEMLRVGKAVPFENRKEGTIPNFKEELQRQ